MEKIICSSRKCPYNHKRNWKLLRVESQKPKICKEMYRADWNSPREVGGLWKIPSVARYQKYLKRFENPSTKCGKRQNYIMVICWGKKSFNMSKIVRQNEQLDCNTGMMPLFNIYTTHLVVILIGDVCVSHTSYPSH